VAGEGPQLCGFHVDPTIQRATATTVNGVVLSSGFEPVKKREAEMNIESFVTKVP